MTQMMRPLQPMTMMVITSSFAAAVTTTFDIG